MEDTDTKIQVKYCSPNKLEALYNNRVKLNYQSVAEQGSDFISMQSCMS